MRRYFVLAILVSLFYSPSVGQADRFDPGKLLIGIKGGFCATAIAPQNNYGQVLLDYKVPLRPLAGIALMYRVGSRSQLVLESNYHVMGQNYEVFAKRTDFRKEVRQDYITFPLMYKLILNKPQGTYGTAATYYNTHWYLIAGVQPGLLIASDSRYEINGAEADFIEFITEGGNPNDDEIASLEPPASSEDLFRSFDLGLTGGAGLFKRIGPRLQVFVEVRGGFSVLDVNAEEWRLPAGSGNYFGSYNMYFGLQAGMAYRVF